MLRSLRIAVFGALFAVSALCVQARAEERFNPEDGVSSAVIKSSGYELTLTNGAVVKLIGASMVQRPDQDCMVHIPSLRRTIERGLRAGTLSPIGTAAQQINLQALQDPTTGEVWCRGAGSGCAIIIQ